MVKNDELVEETMTTNNEPKKFPLSAIQAIEQLQMSIDNGGDHGMLKHLRKLIHVNGPTLMDIVARYFAETVSTTSENIKTPLKESSHDSPDEFWSGASMYPFITGAHPLGYYIDKIKGKWDPRKDKKINDPGVILILNDDKFREMYYRDLSPGRQGALRMAWDSCRRMTGKDPFSENQ